MPRYTMQCSAEVDTALPRDAVVNTLHFDDAGIASDPASLCADLAEAWELGWWTNGIMKLTVRAYEVGSSGPPVAEHVRNPSADIFTSSHPREVALCLSYYGGQNVARRRGRLYLSPCRVPGNIGVRPSAALMAQALALGDRFAGLGGADVDWVLYSPTTGLHHDVTNTWVDDEWDTVRSRGLRSTTRVQGTPGS